MPFTPKPDFFIPLNLDFIHSRDGETAQHSANSRFRGFFHLSCLGPHAKTAHSLVTCITAGAACIYAWNTVETGSGCNVTCAGERTVRSLGEWIKSSKVTMRKSYGFRTFPVL